MEQNTCGKDPPKNNRGTQVTKRRLWKSPMSLLISISCLFWGQAVLGIHMVCLLDRSTLGPNLIGIIIAYTVISAERCPASPSSLMCRKATYKVQKMPLSTKVAPSQHTQPQSTWWPVPETPSIMLISQGACQLTLPIQSNLLYSCNKRGLQENWKLNIAIGL